MDARSPGRETFGTCLLKSSPKIIARHEEELRMLESLHQHMSKRVKADMDYAEQLNKINAAAMKACPKDTKGGENNSIMQMWGTFLQATDKVVAKIQQGVQQMKSLLTSELQPLIKNKRGAGVAFNKDMTKSENEYSASSTEVYTLQQAYKEHTKNANKYKKKVKKSKNDKVIHQYVDHSSQLHNCHNSYVLAIKNANTHQYYYKTALLPFTYDTFQERMEQHVSEWKNVLEKYTKCIDLREAYEDANNTICIRLANVDPAIEYTKFIEQNKTKEDIKLVSYDFDASLAKLPVVRVANPGNLAINTLTMNSLKERLHDLRRTLDELRRQIQEKTSEIESARKDLSHCDGKQKLKWFDNERVQQLSIRICILQGEVESLKCKESCCQAQADAIQQAFDKAGGEGIVPPPFDPAVSDADVDLNTSLELLGGGGRPGGTTTLGRLKHMFGGKSKSHVSIARTNTNAAQANDKGRHPSADSDHSDEDDDDDDDNIDDQPWYYGDIPREDTHQMIKADGDYLVRYSGNKKCYVATTKWDGIIKHFAIQKLDEGYRFEGTPYTSIAKLLKHYRDNKIPVTNRTQAVLVKPINKIILATDEYTMKHDDITLDNKLGKGNFGDVYSGTMRDSGRRVAVKTCRSEHIPAAQQFLAEAEILKQYDHPNIVRLLGVCTDKEPVYIVMELMPGGDFLHFLRNIGANQTIYQLTKFSLDAALGMEYLASKNCIHRDLAARNCLVGENNEILKISDFGMSRETDDDNIYLQSSGCKPVPVKWTSPESLNLGQYTSASDVWSYGVLLFETYSCGSVPYPGMTNQQARDQVDQGYRMSPPEGTPKDVYDRVMYLCWYEDPDDRPTFTDIVTTLKAILSKLPKKK